MVLCCLCAKSIEPNAVTMCTDCIRVQANITDGIAKECDILQCPKCLKFNITRDKWVRHEFESIGLLGMCLKKVHGLESAKILDAKWLWTEPHSKRLKISINVEKEVLEKVVVRQCAVVTFTEKSKMCMECVYDNTAHNWSTCIQIRQKGMKSRKTLVTLENMLVKKPAVLSKLKKIQVKADGLDLFCKQKPFADKLTGFISSNFPVKMKSSKRLVSTASSTQHDRYEFTVFVEIAPIARGDLVVLPPELAGRSELMLVRSVSQSIHCISPVTTAMVDIGSVRYFQRPVTPLLSVDELVPFVVMDIVVVSTGTAASNSVASTVKTKHRYGKGGAPPATDVSSDVTGGAVIPATAATGSHKLYAVLAEAWVCKESELGVQDCSTYHCFTHMGHILHAGDVVMGYDLKHSTKFSGVQGDDGDASSGRDNSSSGSGKRGNSTTKASRGKAKGVSSRDCEYNEILLGKLPYELPDVVLVQKQTARRGDDGSRSNGGQASQKRRGRRRRPTQSEGAEGGTAVLDDDDFSAFEDTHDGGEEEDDEFADGDRLEEGMGFDEYFRDEDGGEDEGENVASQHVFPGLGPDASGSV